MNNSAVARIRQAELSPQPVYVDVKGLNAGKEVRLDLPHGTALRPSFRARLLTPTRDLSPTLEKPVLRLHLKSHMGMLENCSVFEAFIRRGTHIRMWGRPVSGAGRCVPS